jgi:hypothetical protein
VNDTDLVRAQALLKERVNKKKLIIKFDVLKESQVNER